jgi:hypothetical protein
MDHREEKRGRLQTSQALPSGSSVTYTAFARQRQPLLINGFTNKDISTTTTGYNNEELFSMRPVMRWYRLEDLLDRAYSHAARESNSENSSEEY